MVALAASPIEGAATRWRLAQMVGPLRDRGIALTVRPFLSSRTFATLYRRAALPRTVAGVLAGSVSRLVDLPRTRHADVLLVQREAMLFGPPVIEWLGMRLGGCPMVLDLDDATWVPYTSPTYGKLATWLKWPGKTDRLIQWATVVTCGNDSIASAVSARGAAARVVPTVVDTSRFTPRVDHGPADRLPVLGWIGSHSTYAYLRALFPVLQEVARTDPFRLKIVGSGDEGRRVPGLDIELLPWRLDRELEDFRSIDIGLYPITEDAWSVGKSGFKSIQYMAVGVPFVASPVGAAGALGEPGVTHLCARTDDEWRDALRTLLADTALRVRMGAAGRQHALHHYTLGAAADAMAAALTSAATGARRT